VLVPQRKLPDLVIGVPAPERVIVEAVPALKVALAVMLRRVEMVILGVVPPKAVVMVVAPSPMANVDRVNVPTVPVQPGKLVPPRQLAVLDAELLIVTVPLDVKECPEATLSWPESVTPVEPTIKALAAMASVPAVTVTLFLAVAATLALKAWPEELMVRL